MNTLKHFCYTFFLIWLAFFGTLHAQNDHPYVKNDSSEIEFTNQNAEALLNKSDWLKRQGKRDAAWKLLIQARKIGEAQNNQALIARTISDEAKWARYFTKHDTAYVLVKRALDYAQKHELTKLIPSLMVQAGRYALRVTDYDNTFKYCTEAQALAKKQGQEFVNLQCEICINDATGRYFFDLGIENFNTVMESYKKIMSAVLEQRDTIAYLNYWPKYADLYRSVGSLDTFQMMINEATELLKRHPDIRVELSALIMKSIHAALSEDYEGEEYYIRKALKKNQQLGVFPLLTQHYYCRLKDNYAERKQWDRAVEMLDSANMITPKIFFEGVDSYAYIYKHKGDYQKALTYYELWMERRDSLLQTEKLDQVTEWEAKYETQKKELLLAQQRAQQNLLIAILALGIVFSFFLFRAYRSKKRINEALIKQKKTIEVQAEKLRQLDQVKSHFFANVSHELRTPLTLMLGPIQSVISSNQLNNRDFTLLRLAKENGKNLMRLVNEILDLTKLEKSKMEVQESPVLLYALLQRIAAGFESWAQSKEQRFEFHYEPEQSLKLKLDADKFEKIINNLLSNAFKFTPKHGQVQLTLKEFPNRIQVIVADTGRGIHPGDLPHIFDRFYQTKRPEAASEGGTGIGLALCQEFSKLLQGKLWAKSSLEKGSQFYFEFPKKVVLGSLSTAEVEALNNPPLQPTLDHLESTSLNLEPTTNNAQPTLLLVEDNPNLQNYLQLILSEKYKLLFAENGQAALDLLSDVTPALILSDVMMPVMDGFQLLKTLKSDDRYRHLPVIMLTARAALTDKLKALRIGVDDYLLKPFVEEELLVRIENLLENSQNRVATIINATATKTQEPTISATDLDWLEGQEILLKEKLADSQFTIQVWAQEMAMSVRQLQRQLKLLTGLSPQKYLLSFRLVQARELLENRSYATVAEVAYAVGFSSAQTFTRNFKKQFGKLPSGYF